MKTKIPKWLKWPLSKGDPNDSWNKFDNGANVPTKKRTIIALLASALLLALIAYLFVPAWTIYNPGMSLLCVTVVVLFAAISGNYGRGGCIVATIIVLQIVIGMSGSPLMRAINYSQILTVEEGSIENIPSVEEVERIALMDTASAKRLGDREIGVLADIVSQYDVAKNYIQINRQGRPMKVAPLVHSDFWKWMHNKHAGIPGYVVVDPVNNVADYVGLVA